MSAKDIDNVMYTSCVIAARLEEVIPLLTPAMTYLYAEAIDALAYACTFKKPRRFGAIEMDSDKFNVLATTITARELSEVVSALERCSATSSRLFYTLGIFARIYDRQLRVALLKKPAQNTYEIKIDSCGQQYRDDRGYQERVYTKEQLASCVTSIEDLKNMDM